MVKYILSGVMLAIAVPGYSQSLNLDVHSNKLADFLRIEQGLGSEQLENTVTYISKEGVDQPVRFRRKGINVPGLLISYFYFKKDSSIYYVLYEWDDGNFNGHSPKSRKSQAEIKGLIDKYKEIVARVSQTFGKSETKGDLNDLSRIRTGDFQRSDTWAHDDSTTIESTIVLSSKQENSRLLSVQPTYPIRLFVQNTASEAYIRNGLRPARIGADRLNELDSVFKAFIADLQVDSLVRARNYLSGRAAANISNVQLDSLSKNIRKSDPLVIYMSGAVMDLKGSSYLMIMYKYGSDTNNPPLEMLRIMFDGENKILGIQPTKQIGAIKTILKTKD